MYICGLSSCCGGNPLTSEKLRYTPAGIIVPWGELLYINCWEGPFELKDEEGRLSNDASEECATCMLSRGDRAL